MKHKFFSLSTALVALVAFGSMSYAQDNSQDNTQNKSKVERREKRGFGEGHKMRGAERLNLSEAQRQQLRALAESSKSSTEAQRQELRQIMSQRRDGAALSAEQETRAKQLHEQLKAVREKQHADFLAILTPEQRTQIESFRSEGKERRRGGEFGRRGGFGKGIGRGMGGEMRGGLGGLNLSEAQQKQVRQIMEANRTATQTQREQMRQILSQRREAGAAPTADQQARLKELQSQMRASHEKLQSELSAILTAEQRRQIEQRREEMQKRKEERRARKSNASPQIN
jgi:Spy/CpxP family protein refolding chaperone